MFVELMRRGKETYYHSDIQECDFIIHESGKIVEAIQVTVSMEDAKTRMHEIKGLLAAMEIYNLSDATILALEDEEEISVDANRHISVRPIWKWLLGK